MQSKKLQADLMLLLVACIWGFAFVAQRLGMEDLGPFGFNALRFALGACSLLPLLLFFKTDKAHCNRQLLKSGAIAGSVLFAGASFQQAGLVYTSAGNAGFITGLYIILVPLLGLIVGQTTNINTWLGGIIAVFGLYLLSFQDLDQINFGDLLELAGAACWAAHVLIIAKVAPKVDNLRLAITQFLVCAALSAVVGFWLEADSFTLDNAMNALGTYRLCWIDLGRYRLHFTDLRAEIRTTRPCCDHHEPGSGRSPAGWLANLKRAVEPGRSTGLRVNAGRYATVTTPDII